jgi:egghead protein (zeste-white 4 protein)
MISIFLILYAIILPGIVLSWIHILRNWGFEDTEGHVVTGKEPGLTFLITARKVDGVSAQAAKQVRTACQAIGFTNYQTFLVADVDDEALDVNAKRIIVPADYTCKTTYKARALNYALRFLPNSESEWVLHLDEDALATTQGVKSVLNYITHDGKPVSCGPSYFLPQGKRMFLNTLGEAQRHWTLYWLASMLKGGAPAYLNGSNLLVRSDIEQAVGWNFDGFCGFGEDTRFGYLAKEKFGDIFGWHGGITFEQQPATTLGLIRQRRRWFTSSVKYFRFIPRTLTLVLRRVYTTVSWISGATIAVLLIPRLLGFDPLPASEAWVLPLLAVTFALWFARYGIGVYRNMKYSVLTAGRKTFFYLSLMAVPAAEILCALGLFWAIIQPPRQFDITPKERSYTEL